MSVSNPILWKYLIRILNHWMAINWYEIAAVYWKLWVKKFWTKMRFPSNNPILKEEELKLPNTQFYHLLRNCICYHAHSKKIINFDRGWNLGGIWGKYRWNFACVSISHKWPSLRVYLVFRGLVSDTFVFWVNVNEQRRRTCVFIESSYSSHVWYRSHGRNQTVLVYRMLQFVKHFRRSSAISSDYNPNLIRSRSLNELNKGLGTRENRQSFLLHCTLVQNIFKLNIKIKGTFL